MLVTSRTRSDRAIFLLEARIERQYDTKNCRKIAAETTQMTAAIIAPSPSAGPAQDAHPPERVRRYRPMPAAATIPPKVETSGESLVPAPETNCAARKCKRQH